MEARCLPRLSRRVACARLRPVRESASGLATPRAYTLPSMECLKRRSVVPARPSKRPGLLTDPVSTEGLSAAVGAALRSRGFDIATAESCTGGLLAGALTAVAGSSDYVKGGVLAYSNEVKELLLGVSAQTLAAHGAVSEPTAREMALGVRDRLSTAIGVGITGVAGPGGGSPEKPVGLVYIGVATPDATRVRRDVWPGSRTEIRAASVDAAMQLLLEMLGAA